MKHRSAVRSQTVLLALFMATALGAATACDPAPGRPGARPKSASEKLATAKADHDRLDFVAALTKLKAAPHTFTIRGNLPEKGMLEASGAVDPKALAYRINIRMTDNKPATRIQKIAVGTSGYFRDPENPTWAYVNLKKVKDSSSYYMDTKDPTGLGNFTSSIVEVHKTDTRTYEGSFDAKSPNPVPIGLPGSFIIFTLTDLPFKATVNAQGWVQAISITVRQSDGPTVTMTTTMSNFGKPVSIKAPAKSHTEEIPRAWY